MVKFSIFLEARNLSPSAAVMLAIRHTSGYMTAITGLQKRTPVAERRSRAPAGKAEARDEENRPISQSFVGITAVGRL